jgi:hypothetical protein
MGAERVAPNQPLQQTLAAFWLPLLQGLRGAAGN